MKGLSLTLKKKPHALTFPLTISINGLALAVALFVLSGHRLRKDIEHLFHGFVRFSSSSAEPQHNEIHEVFHKLRLDGLGEGWPERE